MSRPLRIEYPGAWYHVMSRGRRGEKIFSGNKDYAMFVALLQEAAELNLPLRHPREGGDPECAVITGFLPSQACPG